MKVYSSRLGRERILFIWMRSLAACYRLPRVYAPNQRPIICLSVLNRSCEEHVYANLELGPGFGHVCCLQLVLWLH